MTTTDDRAILHVDMDAFYASVEQYDRPEYRDRAVIVGGLGNRGVVAAASYEARRFGVHSAMPVSRARRLAPDAIYLRPRIGRYREVSAQIFALFHEVTPRVEGLSLDEAFLDVTGSLRMFGSRERIGGLLRERIRQRTGLEASVGMAHNKFLAKLASDAEKPAGFVSVPSDPAGVRAFLDPMPLRRLWGIGKRTEPKLRALGLLTIGQLRRADPAVLHAALGNRTEHFLALARGEDTREVTPGRAEKSISHEATFETDLQSDREMKAELLRQSEAVARRARKHRLVGRTVQVKIRDHRFHTVTRSLTLRAPTAQTRTVYGVAAGLLDRWLKEHRGTPVRLLGVGLSKLEDPGTALSGKTGIDAAVDEVTRRFGDASLVRALGVERKRR